MVNPFRIDSVRIERVDMALREPFGIASGVQHVANNAVVTVTLADGTQGQGEAAPFPAYNGETIESTLEALHAASRIIEGRDARAWRSCAMALRNVQSASARCALECAVLDACYRAFAMPLWVAWGGVSNALETDYTVATGDAAHAYATAMRCHEEGFSRLKVKVGATTVIGDLERLDAVARAAPGAQILLDGNGGYSDVAVVVSLLERAKPLLQAHGATLVWLEQPMPRGELRATAEIVRAAGVAVVADEDAVNCADVLAIARHESASMVNLKIMKSGVMETLEMAATAKALGLKCMLGGLVESEMAMGVSAALAAGLGDVAWLDLDTPMFLAQSPMESEVQWRGSLVRVNARAGHGVRYGS